MPKDGTDTADVEGEAVGDALAVAPGVVVAEGVGARCGGV